MRRFATATAVALLAAAPVVAQPPAELAERTRQIFAANCFKCHGKDGKDSGGFGHVLDAAKLVESKLIVAGKPEESELFGRLTSADSPMPEKGVEPRPSKDEIEVVRKWIAAGAPSFTAPPAVAAAPRPQLDEKYNYTHMAAWLRKDTDAAPYQRFFTLRHLHNAPQAEVTDASMRLFRAGVSKLLNSLSWRRRIIRPVPIDPHGVILAFDLRELDWDITGGWNKLIGRFDNPVPEGGDKNLFMPPHQGYPYGLMHTRYPDDRELNVLAAEVYRLTGSDVPAIRADWFAASASVPPLYYELLNLPNNAGELERQLKVNVRANFHRDQLARSGFIVSGVSAQANRLVERHDGAFGAYWKSYDFRNGDGVGNLVQKPLGPLNLGGGSKHPYPEFAFEHDGGEIIFALPNRLHAYYLVDGKDRRIDAGPADVVKDDAETAGRGALIVNGLSCIYCHAAGIIKNKIVDVVRDGFEFRGKPHEKVQRLYPDQKRMERYLDADEKEYLDALEEVIGGYVRVGDDAKQKIHLFAEPVNALAKRSIKVPVTLAVAARELGYPEAELKAALQFSPVLRDELGLKLLANGNVVRRQVWESTRSNGYSPFQEAALELKLGEPKRGPRYERPESGE